MGTVAFVMMGSKQGRLFQTYAGKGVDINESHLCILWIKLWTERQI